MKFEKLADTLEIIAKEGADAFYHGRIAEALETHDGLKLFFRISAEFDRPEGPPENCDLPLICRSRGIMIPTAIVSVRIHDDSEHRRSVAG